MSDQKPPNSSNSTVVKKERERTKQRKKLFLRLFVDKVGSISELCKAIRIDRKTYYNWMKADEVFNEDVQNMREALIDFAEGKLLKLIDEKNVAAVIFFLKTQAKHRGYIEKTELGLSGEATIRHQAEGMIDDYFEEHGTDGIFNFFKGLESGIVPRNKRTNH